jgi:branched-chain amino acid aminotransferase
VRLTVFRQQQGLLELQQGLLEPQNEVPAYLIQSWPLPKAGNDEDALVLASFPAWRKPCDVFANLKSNNYLIYSQAASYARRNGWDDCLVLNSHERIADSSISNLFYGRAGKLYTPPLSEGCVAGVMRRFLLEILPGAGFTIMERAVAAADLASADEIFLTNAIRGIRRVARYMDSTYGHEMTDAVAAVLAKNRHFSA